MKNSAKSQQLNKNQLKNQQKTVDSISKLGKKVIFAGFLTLSLGYFILTKTDPMGQNWASIVSPFLILGGYILVAVGIIIPEKEAISSDLNPK